MEFVDLMLEFDRMCDNNKCGSDCPIKGSNISQCRKIAFDKPKEFECLVEKWSKEHPVPRYPTYYEWLVNERVIKRDFTFQDLDIPIHKDFAWKHNIQPLNADELKGE